MTAFFEIPEWETLRVAGIGRTRTGKTTFFSANAIPPVYAIDADKGFVRTRKAMAAKFPEIGGEIFSPSNKGCLVPLFIHQEAQTNILERDARTTVVDSVTKIYGFNTRPAIMAGRMSPADRERFGFSKNKVANLQDKADAIQVLTYLAGYGTNIFYIWHEQETVDMESARSGKLETVMRETMSNEERKRLFTSVDIVLKFSIEKGKYAVRVDPETRGYGNVPNTGFTIYDHPGNFWRGALARLYCLIYTTFESKDEAVSWGMKKLGKEDRVEMDAFYEEVKVRSNPKKHSDMWVAWMLALEEKFLATSFRTEAPLEVKAPPPEAPVTAVVVLPPISEMPEQPPDQEFEQGPDDTDAFETPEEYEGRRSSQIDEQQTPKEDLEEALSEENAHALGVPEEELEGLTTGQVDAIESTAQDLDEALGRVYSNGDEVAEEDQEDFFEYHRRFQKDPFDETVLHRSKEFADDWPE